MRDNKIVMRVKNIVSLIAFFTAFVFSVMLVGLPKDNVYSKLTEGRNIARQQRSIRAFLWADINRGRERDRKLSRLDGIGENFQTAYNVRQIADLTEEYVDGSQSMDASNLPADFQAAWQAHMNAWRGQSEYLNEVKSATGNFSEDSFSNGRVFRIDSESYRQQSDEINQTWDEVLRIGRKYGAYVPIQ
jgi:hypothetical protein